MRFDTSRTRLGCVDHEDRCLAVEAFRVINEARRLTHDVERLMHEAPRLNGESRRLNECKNWGQSGLFSLMHVKVHSDPCSGLLFPRDASLVTLGHAGRGSISVAP